MDFLLPPYLKTARIGFRYLDATGVSRGVFGGPPRTGTRGGDRLHATLEFSPTATSASEAAQERRTLIALLARLQGKQHRLYLTNPARRLAGSFPATELLTNNTFANGTTGWGTQQSTISVHDRVMRLTVAKNIAVGPSAFSQSVTVPAAYVPYVLRSLLGARSRSGLSAGTFTNGTPNYSADAAGLITQVAVPLSASLGTSYPVVFDTAENVTLTGDWIDCPYTSVSRCAQVDNSPNAFQRSDTIGVGAYWGSTGLAGIADDNAAAPDGTTTADTLTENSSGGQHNISRSETRASAAEDWCVGCMVKRGSGTRNLELVIGRDGSNYCRVIFDLGAATAGSPSLVGDATDGRAFIVSMGDGWYNCYVVARLTASTGLFVQAGLASGASISYTGDGTSQLNLWRLGAARSGVPLRLGQTTTAATTGTAQTGTGIYVKGLPASTNGLLLPLDEFELITSYGSELKIVTAALNSDAAGLGYLQFTPPIRGVLADNAAIIIHEPMGYFLFAGDAMGWDHMPGIVTSASAEFEEAA